MSCYRACVGLCTRTCACVGLISNYCPPLLPAVYNRWIGMVDWTRLEWWTGLDWTGGLEKNSLRTHSSASTTASEPL